MRLTALIGVLVILTGCSLPIRDIALDSVDQYRDAKTAIFDQSLNYVCNGASIRDVREWLAKTGATLEEYNAICRLTSQSFVVIGSEQ